MTSNRHPVTHTEWDAIARDYRLGTPGFDARAMFATPNGTALVPVEIHTGPYRVLQLGLRTGRPVDQIATVETLSEAMGYRAGFESTR